MDLTLQQVCKAEEHRASRGPGPSKRASANLHDCCSRGRHTRILPHSKLLWCWKGWSGTKKQSSENISQNTRACWSTVSQKVQNRIDTWGNKNSNKDQHRRQNGGEEQYGFSTEKSGKNRFWPEGPSIWNGSWEEKGRWEKQTNRSVLYEQRYNYIASNMVLDTMYYSALFPGQESGSSLHELILLRVFPEAAVSLWRVFPEVAVSLLTATLSPLLAQNWTTFKLALHSHQK